MKDQDAIEKAVKGSNVVVFLWDLCLVRNLIFLFIAFVINPSTCATQCTQFSIFLKNILGITCQREEKFFQSRIIVEISFSQNSSIALDGKGRYVKRV